MDNKLWIIQLWTTVGCYCFVQNCTQKWQSKITVPPVSWKHQCAVCISRKADFLQGSEWTVREQLLSKDAARELYCWLTWRSYKCLCSHLKCSRCDAFPCCTYNGLHAAPQVMKSSNFLAFAKCVFYYTFVYTHMQTLYMLQVFNILTTHIYTHPDGAVM